MLLSDRDIHTALNTGELTITPLDRNLIQPASVDLRLASDFLALTDGGTRPIPAGAAGIVLFPGQFLLGCTLETIGIPTHLAARVEGKSSLGRRGLLIHATAGFIDPGFCGQVTLELYNASAQPILLKAGMLIAQLCVMPLSSPAQRPYGTIELGSHYQGQRGPTPSRGLT